MEIFEKNSIVDDNKQLIVDALMDSRSGRGLFGFSPDEVNNLIKDLLGSEVKSPLRELISLGVIRYLELGDDEVEYFNSLLDSKYHADNDYSYYLTVDYRNDLEELDYYLVRRLREYTDSSRFDMGFIDN